jgi:hypothetical protein
MQKFGMKQQQQHEEDLKIPAGQKLQAGEHIPQLARSPCHEQDAGHKLRQQILSRNHVAEQTGRRTQSNVKTHFRKAMHPL